MLVTECLKSVVLIIINAAGNVSYVLHHRMYAVNVCYVICFFAHTHIECSQGCVLLQFCLQLFSGKFFLSP